MEAFAYAVSHDLRSPLRGIDGWSQALCEDFGDVLDDKAKTFLSRIRYETMRMHELIEALLKLSRLSKRVIIYSSVDLSTVAASVINKQKAEHPNRRVEVKIEPGLTVMGDSYLLDIALGNLLGNAWKFTEKKDFARIEFGSTVIDGQQVFFVRDNGAGFNMAYAGKLFGAFQRMHKPSEFPGIGIGLATVQRIILRHGGNIWVESAVNEGTTFYWITRSSIK